ncbi:hypothetical protein ACTFIN_10460 [Clostridium cagae]|nr:hypothetical protein [Clostridium sp. M14]MBZ9691596.1 hypothetical protein [Clostridium sp. M14]
MPQTSSENVSSVKNSISESVETIEQVAQTTQEQSELALKIDRIISKFTI